MEKRLDFNESKYFQSMEKTVHEELNSFDSQLENDSSIIDEARIVPSLNVLGAIKDYISNESALKEVIIEEATSLVNYIQKPIQRDSLLLMMDHGMGCIKKAQPVDFETFLSIKKIFIHSRILRNCIKTMVSDTKLVEETRKGETEQALSFQDTLFWTSYDEWNETEVLMTPKANVLMKSPTIERWTI